MGKKQEKVLTIPMIEKMVGIHFTVKHTGKMAGMLSLSTSCLCNKYCMEYAKDPKKICSKCFAQTQMKMYKAMRPCLQRNTEILTNELLDDSEIPVINALYFRFECFGDINNEIQVMNYFKICNKNRQVKFALWTKNPAIIQKVIDKGIQKPKNLQIVLSSHYINVQADKSKYSFVDRVFTVYTKDYIAQHDVKINCGAKSCLNCHKCYEARGAEAINEKLK